MEIRSKRIYSVATVWGDGGVLTQTYSLVEFINNQTDEICAIIQDEKFDEVIALSVGGTYFFKDVDKQYFITRVK